MVVKQMSDRIVELEEALAKAVMALKWYSDDPSSQGIIARTALKEIAEARP